MNVIFEVLAFIGFLVGLYWLCKLGAYCMYLLDKKSGRASARTYSDYVNNMRKEV